MTDARFRFATDILRRLGEELNPSLDHGVLELVKNAHDADASTCSVVLENVEAAGGTLCVTDDGCGMSLQGVVDHFLLLGKSPKDRMTRTGRGRIPAGSKGLGRLAALRAGRRVTMETRPGSESSQEHVLRIDWRDFDHAAVVDDVPVSIETLGRRPGKASGTTIRVEELARGVTRREVRRLARALVLLSDPFGDDPEAFRVELRAEEFREFEALVRSKYFEDAEYHLRARVDGAGRASASVMDWRGETLFRAAHKDLRRNDEPYACPPAIFDLWVFILDAKTFQARASTLGDVRNWLREFGGVLLYVNDLRAPPYGDPGNDWLDMNLQRTRSPEERPSTSTSIGRVRVVDQDAGLVAKTDRSGMIENAAFVDLREMARDCLDWMARERLRVAEQRRGRRREQVNRQVRHSRERLQAVIAGARGVTGEELVQAFEGYDRDRDREVRTLREEVQLYRTLGTAGIMSAVFAHEASRGPLKVIGRAVGTLRRRVGKLADALPEDVAAPLDSIESSARSLGAFTDSTLDLVARDKRRTTRVRLHDAVADVLRSYSQFFQVRDVAFDYRPGPGDPCLMGSVAAVESIIVNLLTNALVALSDSKARERRIRLETRMVNGSVELRVADNGDGLGAFSADEIWLPGVTSQPDGSGLGLTIVRDTARDLGGTAVVAESRDLGGVEFTISLPAVGA